LLTGNRRCTLERQKQVSHLATFRAQGDSGMALPPKDAAHQLPAARAGSREALGQVLEACRGYLLRIANQGIGADLQAKGGASDLVQETFLEAQRDFARFQGNTEAELLAWLRCLLLNNVANFARGYRATGKRQVGREVALEGGDSSGAGEARFVADTPSPSTEAMAHEQAEAIARALERLPEDYRRVITLRNQERRDFDDIGRLMDRSPDAARRLWSRAIERLEHELEATP
jgi:RNA polymerase sigma-70 factor, ECF subfamily